MAQKSKGMQIFLGIALGLLLFGLFNLGVHTFYPSPDYEEYCGDRSGPKFLDTQIECEADGGQWTSREVQCVTTPCPQGYCDVDFTCREDYDTARDSYNNIIFYVFVIAGLGLAVSGMFLTTVTFQIVGLGAGIGLIGEGILRNLNEKIPAFIAGVVAFSILSYVVWRQVKD